MSPQTNIQITYTVTLGYKTLTGKIGETKAYEGTFTNVKSKLYQYNSSEVLLGKDVGGLYIHPIYQNNPTRSPQENNYNVFIGNESGRFNNNTSSQNVFIGAFTGKGSDGFNEIKEKVYSLVTMLVYYMIIHKIIQQLIILSLDIII